jgi:hypothetical protein
MMKTSERYIEDFAVGQSFGSGRLRVDKGQIKTFAAEFDPQPPISTRRRRRTRSSRDWPRAAGTLQRSPCGFS